MSYDLEVRPRARFGSGVPRETVASFLLSLPGVVRTNLTSFALDRPSSGVTFSIDIGQQTGEDDEPGAPAPESVNYVAFLVPYPSLDMSGPVAVEMAVQLAEKLDWSVYDLQAEREVSRDTLPDTLRLQKSHGGAAREVLERAVAAELSLGELFMQEMWNHKLIAMVACVVLAVIGTAWFLLALDRPRDDFSRYMPWGVAVGAVVLMWIKGLAQAVVRHRRRR
jgi:hypothetical protein